MARQNSFRARLTWSLVLLSAGCLLLLSVAVLGTAVKIIGGHFEEMAVDSTMLSAQILSHIAPGPNTGNEKGGERETLLRAINGHSSELIGERALLFDDSGSLVSAAGTQSQVRDPALIKRLAGHAARILKQPGIDHIEARGAGGLWVGAPVAREGGSPGFAVFLLHDMAAAERLVRLTAWYVLGLAGLLSGVAWIIGSRVSRRLANPLRMLHRAARQFGEGNLAHRIAIDDTDEFGQVAEAFNEMAASLKTHVKEVERETQRREQWESELRIAAHLQQSLLPRELPTLGVIEFSASSRPAREVGGDFYDVIVQGKDTVYLAIGDATNKGLPAAIHATQCASAIRTLAREGYAPANVLRQVNTLLHENLGDSYRFVTVFLARFDLATRELTYSVAGHNPPVLLRAAGGPPILLRDGLGLPLGAFQDSGFQEQSVQLAPGDVLLLYTDGLNEATSGGGKMLGLDAVIHRFQEMAHGPGDRILEALLSMADAHEGGHHYDDLTMLIARIS